jgi:hypothetical protein
MMRRLLTAFVLLGLAATLPDALAGTVSVPDGGTAAAPFDPGRPARKDAAPELEIVDRAQCIVRKSALEQRALGSMKFSAKRHSGVNDPADGKAHIRWIVTPFPTPGAQSNISDPRDKTMWDRRSGGVR